LGLPREEWPYDYSEFGVHQGFRFLDEDEDNPIHQNVVEIARLRVVSGIVVRHSHLELESPTPVVALSAFHRYDLQLPHEYRFESLPTVTNSVFNVPPGYGVELLWKVGEPELARVLARLRSYSTAS
jgi:hypothetical protein